MEHLWEDKKHAAQFPTARDMKEDLCSFENMSSTGFLFVDSIPGHTTGGSQRGTRRGGGAGSGRTVRQQICAQREQSYLAFSKASRTHRLHVSAEAQTSETLCKPMKEQNLRLTTSSSPVYHRFVTGTKSALFSWMPTSRTTPLCLCKPFSCRASPEINHFAWNFFRFPNSTGSVNRLSDRLCSRHCLINL